MSNEPTSPPDEPDWSQIDPSADQVKEWMRAHASDYASPRELGRGAHEHFHRPFHINVLVDWAQAVMA